MSLNPLWADTPNDVAVSVSANSAHPVVLIVEDHEDARPDLKQVLKLKGCRVIEVDNGRDAAREARQTRPDLLVVDLDVPLLYGLVAARQIVKHAEVGTVPVVIVAHEEVLDPAPLIEVGATRDEYVTRLSDYEELRPLLDYLLPVLPSEARIERESALPGKEPGSTPWKANIRELHPAYAEGVSS